MKNRLLAAGVLAVTLAVAGCAPAQTGGSPETAPSAGDAGGTEDESQNAMPSMAAESPGDDGNSAPDDYDY